MPAREAAPLTGLPLVKKENLYANLRFPQADLAILMFTLNAIMQDPEPERLLKEFLAHRVSDEEATQLLERANRAHTAFLDAKYVPELTTERMRNLWIVAQNRTILTVKNMRTFGPKIDYGKFMLNGALPLHTMRTVLKAGVDAFRSEEAAPLLHQYREAFRDYKPVPGGNRAADTVRNKIYALVRERVRAAIQADKKVDERQARVLFNSLTDQTWL